MLVTSLWYIHFKTTSPEPLVQIQNNFSEMLLIMLSVEMPKRFCPAKQDVSRALGKKYFLLNHWSKCEMISQKCLSLCPLTK